MLKNNIEAQVTMQDIIFVAQNKSESYGEFNQLSAMQLVFTDADETIIRLYNTIQNIAVYAARLHIYDNYHPTGGLISDKKNNITRIATNEFFFYTTHPLTIEKFQELQQKIADLVKNLPQNLHLALGTFAVLTPDNKVMNVASYIECGKNPIIHLVTKNNPYSTDPNYFGCPNIDAGTDFLNYKIEIDNQPIYFSFNNVFECKTIGGAKFYICLDICADYEILVGKKNLIELLASMKFNDEELRSLIIQGSQLLLSNSIYLEMGERIFGSAITYVDPLAAFQPNDLRYQRVDLPRSQFGKSAFMYTLNSSPCPKLPENLLVEVLLQSIALQKDPSLLQNAIDEKIGIIQSLIQEGANPNIKNKFDLTALNYAVLVKRWDIVKTLLDNRADPHISDDENRTPLHYSIIAGNFDITKTLLEKIIFEGFLYKKDNKDMTPLHYAVLSGNLNIIKLLLEKIEPGNKNVVDVFKNISPEELKKKDEQGQSLAEIAAQTGHADFINILKESINDFSQQKNKSTEYIKNVGLFPQAQKPENEIEKFENKDVNKKKY